TLPPKPWSDYAGLVERGGVHFEMAHLNRNGVQVAVLAPLNSDILSNIIPGMADVQFIDLGTGKKVQSGPVSATSTGKEAKRPNGPVVRIGRRDPDPKLGGGRHLPPAANQFDFEVYWLSSPRMPDWSQPDEDHVAILTITTRPSAVVNVLFGAGFT